MKDSADIRKWNKLKIKQLLFGGELFSKQQIALKTGLSVATCNTLLNEMEEAGEVLGEKKRMHDVGRGTVCYCLNHDYESFLCFYLDVIGDNRIMDISVVDAGGREKAHKRKDSGKFKEKDILKEIESVCKEHPNISQIIMGIPGLFTDGRMEHCDCPELNGWECAKEISQLTGVPVYVENDMYLKAFGYYKKGAEDQIVTLAYFPEKLLPGTVSVGNGIIWKGTHQFAGMVGFLPFEMDRKEVMERLKKDTCRPLISKAMTSIIVLVNPAVIVVSGALVDEESLSWIREDVRRWIPDRYLPEFVYENDFTEIYRIGMYQKALSLKEEALR